MRDRSDIPRKDPPQRPRRPTHAAGPPWDPSSGIVVEVIGVGADHRWGVSLHLVRQADGALYLFGIDVRPSGVQSMRSMSELPPGGLTARALRSIALGQIFKAVVARNRGAGPDPALRVPGDLPPPGSRPGRRRLSDAFCFWVAVNYLKAAQADPGAPVRRMHETLGAPYPRHTIKGWVVEARKRGFLGRTARGKAGGGAGPRLPDLVPNWDALDGSEARDALVDLLRTSRPRAR